MLAQIGQRTCEACFATTSQPIKRNINSTAHRNFQLARSTPSVSIRRIGVRAVELEDIDVLSSVNFEHSEEVRHKLQECINSGRDSQSNLTKLMSRICRSRLISAFSSFLLRESAVLCDEHQGPDVTAYHVACFSAGYVLYARLRDSPEWRWALYNDLHAGACSRSIPLHVVMDIDIELEGVLLVCIHSCSAIIIHSLFTEVQQCSSLSPWKHLLAPFCNQQ